MKSVWKPRHEGTAPPIEEHGPVPSVIKRILAARDLKDPEQIEKFLFPKLQNLKDPSTMLGMEKASQRLLEAFQKKEKVAVYADFDLDGTSGLALMMTGLQSMGYENLVPYQPSRLSEGYGFHPEAVEVLAKENVSLIVTVDVGITALEATHKAQELGVDVIITDHHLPGPELPQCYSIINPNQPGDTSELGYLSGAGVAFYLLRSLKRALVTEGVQDAKDFDLKEVLDYFTIATLTDMVPLVDDNRVLVKHGLHKLSQTGKPGLRALKEALSIEGRSLSSQDVAIKLAPKLNALSRMGSEILPIDIMLCDDFAKAESLISRVLENNQLRVSLQAQAEVEIQNYLATAQDQDFVFLVSPRFHRGLVGLLATKVCQESGKPSFVGSLDEETNMVVGSARRPPGFDGCLVQILTAAKDHLKRFGGHSQAAGFEFSYDQVDAIREDLTQAFATMNFKNGEQVLVYDTELQFSEVTPSLMKWLENLGPYGAQFEVPLFCFKDLKLQSVRELRGGHLRLTCINKEGNSLQEALLFSPTRYQRDLLTERSMSYDILGELQWNYYNGQQSVQMLVRDIRVSLWQ